MHSTFADDLFEPIEERRKLSRREKQEDRHKEGLVRTRVKPQRRKGKRNNVIDIVNGIELRHLQETDESLATL